MTLLWLLISDLVPLFAPPRSEASDNERRQGDHVASP